MKTDPLTAQYLRNHPADAARLLEGLPEDRVHALLASLPADPAGSVLAHFLAPRAARLLQTLDAEPAAEAVLTLPFSTAVRVLRHLERPARQALEKHLPAAFLVRLHSQLQYTPRSVGAVMHPPQPVLPVNITAGEAIKRIEDGVTGPGSLVYLHDEAHKLRGALHLDDVLRADPAAALGSLRPHQPPALSALETLAAAMGHPAWLEHVQLPVTDKDGVLLGVVSYLALHQAAGTGEAPPETAPSTPLTLLEQCWLALLRVSTLALQRHQGNTAARSGEGQ